MLLALVVMACVWGASIFIGTYWLKTPGVLISLLVALSLAFAGAFIQVYISASFNEASGVQTDGMGYIRNGFITLCVSMYAVYKTLRSKAAQPPSE